MADPNLFGRELSKGEFVLREWLGDGGFGDVYRADQPKLGREVVVKVLRQRLRFDGAVMRRFMREAQLASRLDHPYAAHVYAFGVETDGLLWIAMEMVHGVTLDRWLSDREPLTLDELVPFLERVADVVQTAHDNGFVHRDLKPANIMVIERAGKLLPKLLDFGLAKLLDGSFPDDAEIADLDDDSAPRDEIAYVGDDELASVSLKSEDGARTEDAPRRLAETDSQLARGTPRTGPTVRPPYRSGPYRRPGRRVTEVDAASGSPPYMSPEQWTSSMDVGPSTDLYALGVIAYEALTGRRPFGPFTGLSAANSYSEAHRFAPVPPLGDGFAPALDRFFQRALAKRPEDRWGTAIELAAALRTELEARLRTQVRVAARQWQDRGHPRGLLWRDDVLAELERWLRQAGTPLTGLETEFVEASRAQAVASRRRTVRARQGLAAVGVAVLVGVVAYPVVLQKRSAEHEVTQVKIEAGRQAQLHGESAEARLQLGEAYRRGDDSQSTKFMLARALQPRLAELARLPATKGHMWSATFSPDGSRIVTSDDKAAQIWDARTSKLLHTLPHNDAVYEARYNPDGTRVITAGADGLVKIWDASRGLLVRELTRKRSDGKPSHYYAVVMSPDGRLVAAIDTMGEVVHVWDAITGAAIAELLDDGSQFPSLAFSADGHWLATSGGDDVRLFDTATWRPGVTLAGPGIRSLSWDPAEPHLLTGSAGGDASIWAIPSGARIHHLREIGEPIDAVAFSPDGQLVAAASRDGAEQVWNASGELRSQGNYLRGKIQSIEFDPASRLVVAAGASGTVAVADAALGMSIAVLEGPEKLVRVAHFDPTSHRVVGASWDGTTRVWDATSPYRLWASPRLGDDCNEPVSLVPDQRFVAIGCRDHGTRILDTAHDRLLAELPPVTQVPGDFASALPAVSAEGDRAAIARGNTVAVYELPGGRLLRTIAHSAPVNAVAFGPVGHDLVSGAVDGSLLVTRDDREPIALPRSPDGIDAAAVLADGRVVAAAGTRLRVYDPDCRGMPAELEAPARMRLLRASPDGRRLVAIARFSETIKPMPTLWDLESYRRIAQLEGHVGLVYSARFVLGGREILTAGGDGTARLWDGVSGQLHQTYRGGTRFLADAELAPDGAMIVAGGADGMLRFWDVASGRQLWMLEAHRSALIGVHFEGTDIVTRGLAGDASRWTLPSLETVFKGCGKRDACAIVPQ